jgi:alpha/beta superfamily hydrolase
MNAVQVDPAVNAANSLKNINLPVLDLYGSKDLDFVLSSAEKKRLAATHNKAYTQKMVKGANHFFDGKNDELIEVVDEWCSKL